MQLFLLEVQHFITYLQVEKDASQHTVNSYRSDIGRFVKFIQKQGVSEVIFANITPVMIRAYLNYLKNKGYARHTIARRMASLRSFFRYLCKKEIIKANPVQGIYLPIKDGKTATVLEINEVEALLRLPKPNLLGCRDKAMLELTYASGLRISELTGLLISDIDIITCHVLLYGRGAKERVVPIGKQGMAALMHYIEQVRPSLCAQIQHDRLFVNSKGGPITSRSVRRIFENYFQRLVIDKQVSPQMLRQSLAVHLLKNGANVSFVQELLGTNSCQPCNHLSRENVKVVYNNAHPRA